MGSHIPFLISLCRHGTAGSVPVRMQRTNDISICVIYSLYMLEDALLLRWPHMHAGLHNATACLPGWELNSIGLLLLASSSVCLYMGAIIIIDATKYQRCGTYCTTLLYICGTYCKINFGDEIIILNKQSCTSSRGRI